MLIRVRKIARPEVEGLLDERDASLGVTWEPIPAPVEPSAENDAPPPPSQPDTDAQSLIDAGLSVEDVERLTGKKTSGRKSKPKGNDLSAYDAPIKG